MLPKLANIGGTTFYVCELLCLSQRQNITSTWYFGSKKRFLNYCQPQSIIRVSQNMYLFSHFYRKDAYNPETLFGVLLFFKIISALAIQKTRATRCIAIYAHNQISVHIFRKYLKNIYLKRRMHKTARKYVVQVNKLSTSQSKDEKCVGR